MGVGSPILNKESILPISAKMRYLNENIFVQRFSLIFAPLGKMCYVVFMVISSYFLSNANVKSKRFWKVWMEVLFYNILMMLVTLVGTGWNGLLSIKMIVGSILPKLVMNSHAFATLCEKTNMNENAE